MMFLNRQRLRCGAAGKKNLFSGNTQCKLKCHYPDGLIATASTMKALLNKLFFLRKKMMCSYMDSSVK